MHCPRLNHFVRINSDGTIGRCGHMHNPQRFRTLNDLEKSTWLQLIKSKMSNDEWPEECVRCEQSESVKNESIRTNSIKRDNVLKPIREDYLIVGGVLDNICNSACQTCNSNLSTKIGSLESKNYKRINNYDTFESLPKNRIVEIDINGGEPTASKNYRKMIKDLPAGTRIVRMNTNGSKYFQEVERLLEKKITVIVTLSLDGVGQTHDYLRWPVRWESFTNTVSAYQNLQKRYKQLKIDFWTTVSCLNIHDLENIISYAEQKNIPHDWAFLNSPDVLNVKFTNVLTKASKHLFPDKIAIDKDNNDVLVGFVNRQDLLRGIDVRDYLSFWPK